MALKVGLQMHSLREYMRAEPLAALKRAAEIGYRYIELPSRPAGEGFETFYGKTAKEWLECANQCGAAITGGYVKGITPGNIDRAAEFLATLGSERITIPIDYFPDRSAVDKKCDLYNRIGEKCKGYGLKLHYENHYHEFQTLDNVPILDILMKQTDKRLFFLSLNSYWMMRGLVDPREVFNQYSKRVGTLVQQDYPLDQIDKFNMWNFERYHPIAKNIKFDRVLTGGEIENIQPVQCELFTEIGTGIMNLQALVDIANQSGQVSYVFLKQDYTRMPSEFDSIALSREKYLSVRDVEWL